MQAEAAIPEDILDQQHIEDVDAFDAEDSMQYVGESDVDGYAAIEPEADIILAAQKFSTSESNREEEEEYLKQNSNDSGNSGDNNKRNNNKIVHLKKSVGKRNNKLKSDADNSDNNNNKYDSDNGNAAVYTDQMDELDGLDVSDEEPLALPSTREAKSFRLTKDPKEQQNEGLIAEGEDSDEKGVRDVTGQHAQLIENLVAEKFNKASVQTIHNEKKAKDTQYSYSNNNNNSRSNMNNSHDDGDDDAADVQDENNKNSVINTSNNMSKQVNNKSEMEYTDGNQLEEIAIGDIEDKFRNEDEDALEQQQQLEQEHKNAASHGGRRGGSEQVALAALMEKNDDEDVEQSEKFVAKKIKRHERADIASHDESKNNKNLNSDNNSNNHNKHTYKRHHYGEPHKENEQYGNTFAHKPVSEKVVMPKNQQHKQQQQQDEGIEEKLEVADSNGSSDEKGPQTDYSITYFGILTNSSQRREEEEEKDYVRELPLNASEYSAKTTNNVAKIANSDDAAKLEVVHATRNQQQQQQYEQQHQLTDETPDAGESYATHMSAFEHYKAQRRNSRRYGHKMYKKKYKDYLSYATMSSLTARAMGIAIEATTTAVPEISTALSAQANVIAMSAEHTINSTQAKMTNNNYTDYYRKQDQEQQQQQQQWQRQHLQQEPISVRAQKHAEKLRKYSRKIEAEKSRRLPASPIFVVGNRNGGAVAATIDSSSSRSGEGANPFYEGQINYYLETRDEEDTEDTEGTAATEANNKTIDGNGESKENADVAVEKQREERLRAHGGSMERMIAADNSNWYQRVSPVLRNGIKVFSNEGKHQRGEATSNQKQNVHKQQKQQQHDAQHTHHYERNHYQHQHHHHHQHQHQQHHRQHPHPHMHAYKQQQQHHGIHQHRRGGSGNHHKHRQHGKHYQSTDTRQLQQQQHTSNPYQRILPTSLLSPPSPHASATQAAVEMGMVQTPIPPPSYTKQHQQQQQTEAEAVGSGAQQLGHQITELEELERYYAKWPHLARVQFQVYDEHYREAHPELYPEMKDDAEDADEDYDDDYESAAELEEAQNGHDEDANLPPYIKKYNRRNKQLLNLLEGTLAPPTRPPPAIMRSWSSSLLQPGPHASSRSAGGGGRNGVGRVRIDDDYLKEKRKRYHNRDISSTSTSSVSGSNTNNRKEDLDHYQDLFAQQRPPSTTTTEIPDTPAGGSANKEASSATKKVQNKANIRSTVEKAAQSTNQLPDEDVSISTDTDADADTDTDIDAYAADDADVDIWPKEIENKSNANELTGSAQMTWQIEKLTTPKPMQHLSITPSTPKPAIYRLPSYPAIAGSFIGKPRSRSAQFAPSGGSRGKLAFVAAAGDDLHSNRWSNIYGRGGGIIGNYGGGGDSNGLGVGLGIGGNHHKSLSRFSAYKPNAHKALTATAALTATSTTAPTFLWHAAGADMDGKSLTTAATAITVTPSGGSSSDDGDGAEGGVPNGGVGRTISSFVYHRVIDASPRLVGTGATGRKQRLPFVAITDRRLETTKKALLERQKDFEQNHYPMP